MWEDCGRNLKRWWGWIKGGLQSQYILTISHHHLIPVPLNLLNPLCQEYKYFRNPCEFLTNNKNQKSFSVEFPVPDKSDFSFKN